MNATSKAVLVSALTTLAVMWALKAAAPTFPALAKHFR